MGPNPSRRCREKVFVVLGEEFLFLGRPSFRLLAVRNELS